MPRIPLPFGQGLDRETGVMVASPGSMEDLRNVLVHQGKVKVRMGFGTTVQLVDGSSNAMTHICAGHALRAKRIMIVVGYNSVDGKVHVFRVDNMGVAATHIAEWTSTGIFPLAAGSDPPLISMAESGGNVFMAHDTLRAGLDGSPPTWTRAESWYYNGSADTAQVMTSQDFGDGSEAPRFRGFVRHLDYLFGWGWGHGSEERPELVRASNPGLPLTWNAEHYFIVGDRGDPVLRCIPAGPPSATGVLLALKDSETYEIIGYSRDTFGVRPLDTLYGIENTRLAVNVGGNVFVWTAEGPRLFDGSGPSTSIEIPLELPEPEPSTLVDEGALRWAFAEYVPLKRVVIFVWGRRVYALTVRVPGDWKWSYWELGFDPQSAWRVPVTGSGLVEAPTGFPDNLSSANVDCCSADITVDNNSQDGDEVLELWSKPVGGSWTLNGSFAVGGGASQTHKVTLLDPGVTNYVRARYRRGPFYTAGYESTDPEDWPSSSETSFATTLNTPTVTALDWERTSAIAELMNVQVTLAAGHAGVNVEIRRGGNLVHTEVAPAGTFVWQDTAVTGETLQTYVARHVTTQTTGSDGTGKSGWVGPTPGPSNLTGAPEPDPVEYSIDWTNGDVSLKTQIRDNYDPATNTIKGYPFRQVDRVDPGVNTYLEATGQTPPGNITVGVRHIMTQYGVDDFSPDATTLVVYP